MKWIFNNLIFDESLIKSNVGFVYKIHNENYLYIGCKKFSNLYCATSKYYFSTKVFNNCEKGFEKDFELFFDRDFEILRKYITRAYKSANRFKVDVIGNC